MSQCSHSPANAMTPRRGELELSGFSNSNEFKLSLQLDARDGRVDAIPQPSGFQYLRPKQRLSHDLHEHASLHMLSYGCAPEIRHAPLFESGSTVS